MACMIIDRLDASRLDLLACRSAKVKLFRSSELSQQDKDSLMRLFEHNMKTLWDEPSKLAWVPSG